MYRLLKGLLSAVLLLASLAACINARANDSLWISECKELRDSIGGQLPELPGLLSEMYSIREDYSIADSVAIFGERFPAIPGNHPLKILEFSLKRVVAGVKSESGAALVIDRSSLDPAQRQNEEVSLSASFYEAMLLNQANISSEYLNFLSFSIEKASLKCAFDRSIEDIEAASALFHRTKMAGNHPTAIELIHGESYHGYAVLEAGPVADDGLQMKKITVTIFDDVTSLSATYYIPSADTILLNQVIEAVISFTQK